MPRADVRDVQISIILSLVGDGIPDDFPARKGDRQVAELPERRWSESSERVRKCTRVCLHTLAAMHRSRNARITSK